MKTQLPLLRGLSLTAMRLLVALIFLWHGVPKAFNIPASIAKFEGFGLPGIMGPITGWAEVLLAILVILGLKHRVANMMLAMIIMGAIMTVQLPGGISAGLERDLLILAATFILAVHGPGLFALDPEEKTTTEVTIINAPTTT